jgi:hypothetical protein
MSMRTFPNISDQIQRKKKERISQAIIDTRLGNDDLLQLLWDMPVREFTFQDRVG